MSQSAASTTANAAPRRNVTVAVLLADLRSAHENLAATMHDLGELTRGPLPDRNSYTGARGGGRFGAISTASSLKSQALTTRPHLTTFRRPTCKC